MTTLPWFAGFHAAPVTAFHEPMPDRELVAKAQAGEIAGFEQLYRRHAGRVYGLCLRLTGDPASAEDLTQEAFVRAWQKLPSFRGKSAFATWLHRLTVNVVIGHLRTLRRRGGEAPAGDRLEGLPASRRDRGPAAAIDLERAIAALPPKARLVFVLHDVEGFRHAEVAKLVGIAEGTSKAHLHRARRQLREALRG